jgi:methylated-DNA-protein-cysteine methyltransferase-like protein
VAREELILNMIEVIDAIPSGKVSSYSGVGRAMTPPMGGRQVGRLLFTLVDPHVCAWWKVMAADGSLSIGKLNPASAAEQRRLLEKDGIVFRGEKVAREFFIEPVEID